MVMRYGIDIGIPNPPVGLDFKEFKEKEIQQILDQIDQASKPKPVYDESNS